MKNLFYLLIVVLISGCSLKQEITDINSYSIDFNSKNKSYKNTEKSILIEEPLVNKSFNSRSIFYSPKPYLFEEYAKNRWINLPSSMIHNSLLESFQSSKIFSIVSFDKFLRSMQYSAKFIFSIKPFIFCSYDIEMKGVPIFAEKILLWYRIPITAYN